MNATNKINIIDISHKMIRIYVSRQNKIKIKEPLDNITKARVERFEKILKLCRAYIRQQNDKRPYEKEIDKLYAFN